MMFSAPVCFRSVLVLVLLALVAGCGNARTPVSTTHDVRSQLAPIRAIPLSELDTVLELIKPSPGESRFEAIPWLPTLLLGRREAAKQGKPIVAFMMSGHPMGCT